MENNKTQSEVADPNPEYLIKSIAEQGYSLESSLADLMDNSVSANANKIEVLIKMEQEPFTLFIADNGNGMDEETLKASMQFPSNSPENERNVSDLGRFGLGMKTASFSQCRRLTVKTRNKSDKEFIRCWDLDFVADKKDWVLLRACADAKSEKILSEFSVDGAGTIILWESHQFRLI